jgi:hypothetical protein
VAVDPRSNSVSNGTRSVLRGNPDATARLPPPGEPFRLAEAPDELRRVFRRFRAHGVLDVVDDPRDEPKRYRTNPAAFEAAREIRASRDTLPCGHGGLRNRRDEDGYTCGYGACDARFDRRTVLDCLG